MKIRQKIANLIAPTAANAAGDNLARDFWRYGNRNPLMRGWAETQMTEADKYTGQMYGSIRTIRNIVVELGTNNLRTRGSKAETAKAKSSGESLRHPYLDYIDRSNQFQNDRLYADYSTYMSLNGVYYIYVLRNFTRRADGSTGTVGKILELKLLNAYHVERIIDPTKNTVEGYREYNGGLMRDIAPEQIIEVRDPYPFDWNRNYGMADAAKDSQFTLKTASDYTRHAINGNINAPGIVSTDVVLSPEQLANFKSRFVGHQQGEPVFADGKGRVTWTPMTTDLDKAALDKIHAGVMDDMISVTGVGKTMLHIEQSGVTRDSSKIQKDLLTADIAVPQLRMLIGALNQDYRRHYADQWESTDYELYIDNPLGSDHEAELKDSEVRTSNLELYKSARDYGFNHAMASKYAMGEVSLEDMGEPTEESKQPPAAVVQEDTDPKPDEPKKDPKANHVHNAIDVQTQAGSLKMAVVRVQTQLVAACIAKVQANAYDSESDVVEPQDKRQAITDLELALNVFYRSTMPLEGQDVIRRRLDEFAGLELVARPSFVMDREVTNYIEAAAERASKSHIDTVLNDVLEAVRKAAVKGVSRDDLTNAIRQEFTDISTVRAELIAKNETYNAFAQAQLEADRQFLTANGLMGRAYKRVRNRSGNPCIFCKAKAGEEAIPFEQAFAELGTEIEAVYEKKDGTSSLRKLPINYETVQAAHFHAQCQCDYTLEIR